MTQKKRKLGYGKDFQLMAKAGELAVASKLALLGHVPMFPFVDVGFDIMLENGLRLQVKAAHLKISSRGVQSPGYNFNLRRAAWDGFSGRSRQNGKKKYSEVADFFVLWGIDENRFFILPTVGASQTAFFMHRGYAENFGRKNGGGRPMDEARLREIEDRWDLLDMNTTSSELIESAVEEKLLAV